MSVSALLAMGLAASFTCLDPTHHDGDNLRCSNVPGSMRLNGIDAPEMPGACRPGRRCVEGDPYAARDQLRSITAGKALQCVQEDTDSYGRRIVNCTADGVNISCAMIASGHAVPRYAPLDCSGSAAPDAVAEARPAPVDPPRAQPAEPPPVIATPEIMATAHDDPAPFPWRGLVMLLAALGLINAACYAAFAIDKHRARNFNSRNRISERTLLNLALIGGSPAAWYAINRLRHKSAKDSFKQRLLLITGLQIGLLIGGLYWWLTG